MTKRDYEMLAEVIGRQHLYSDSRVGGTFRVFVEDLAQELKSDNVRFNKDRFFRAAGFPELADN